MIAIRYHWEPLSALKIRWTSASRLSDTAFLLAAVLGRLPVALWPVAHDAKWRAVSCDRHVIQWTKASRDAPHAAPRRAVPAALRLPPLPIAASEPTLVRHDVRYSEVNGFREPLSNALRDQLLTATVYEHNVAIT